MGRISIHAEDVGKKYFLNRVVPRSDSLTEGILTAVKSFGRGLGQRNALEEFWALKDVSFSVNQGDRVAIIGRNGAGKSTLLKILSRVVKPTTGRIEYMGRMASLLEVGTGFHGDLSGRENIFLNGSILGMSRHEIAERFDEIVEFSEVGQFLDTPVKRYSSGMYVRLAFAVAAHLQPDILIVDEVLAVGDTAFQKKCLGKMQDVSTREGRTILFVSHNMDAVQRLCNKGMLLHKGSLVTTGDMDMVMNAYISNSNLSNGHFDITLNQLQESGIPGVIKSVRVLSPGGDVISEAPTGSSWSVEISLELHKVCPELVVGLGLQGLFGDPINTSWTPASDTQPGAYKVTFTNSSIFYNTGTYKLAVGLSSMGKSFFYNDTEAFIVVSEAGVPYEEERIVNRSSGLILNPMNVRIEKA